VHKTILAVVGILAVGSSLAATPAKPHKRHHPVKAASSSSASKGPKAATKAGTKVTSGKTASASATKSSSTRRKGKTVLRAARSYQQAPTPDRYKEIQQALATKGYFRGEPNGQWGDESTDALKRFQTDQNLMPDGKINSLSLIALGLGPKRLTAKSDAVPTLQVAPHGTSPTPLPAPTPDAPPPAPTTPPR
jgi:hypothetical protein